jgi:chaperonin cofactor prefoldin
VLKEAPVLFDWMESEKTELFKQVGDLFFGMTKLVVPISLNDQLYSIDGLRETSMEESDVGLLPGN